MNLILHETPASAALLEARAELTAIRLTLTTRESALAQLRAQLKAFESRYLHQVGVLYAEIDELEARIAEREIALYDSDSARRRAAEARRRAQETHDSAFAAEEEPEEVDPPPTLKSLFRELARRIHPDFAADAAEQQHFTALMARANHAYSRGDLETLQRLLDDRLELAAATSEEGPAAELTRITRQVRHAQRDLAALDAEQQAILDSELGQLHQDAGIAEADNRDLLAELAATLRTQIADAQARFDLIDRQITAHGK